MSCNIWPATRIASPSPTVAPWTSSRNSPLHRFAGDLFTVRASRTRHRNQSRQERSLASARAVDVCPNNANQEKTGRQSASTPLAVDTKQPRHRPFPTLNDSAPLNSAAQKHRRSIHYPYAYRVRRKRGRLPSNVSIKSDPAADIPPTPPVHCAGSLQIES